MKLEIFSLFLLSVFIPLLQGSKLKNGEFLYGVFPPDFLWGLATSSYQIEGGWDQDGKGVSIWDTWSKESNGSNILDRSNGDVACDSYHKYLDDVLALKNMGVDFYRFSIAWSRILPNGTLAGGINQRGIDYYNKLIDALLAQEITPFVTIYHWDLPQRLQDIGGWPNQEIAQHYADYADLLFSEYGDRVKTWITFNEPIVFCNQGYGSRTKAPGISDPGVQPYQCAHTLLKAHGLAYRNYEKRYKAVQGGQVGITLYSNWDEPLDKDDPEHVAASERFLLFNVCGIELYSNLNFGWFASPLYRGDYPPIMRELVDKKSFAEGRNVSRLPSFDETWTEIINGTLDFIGVNHYTTNYVYPTTGGGGPGLSGDSNTDTSSDKSWEGSAAPWLKVVPWGFRKLLNWIGKEYAGVPIYITENGYPDKDTDGPRDDRRVNYYREYINEMLKAVVLDGIDIRAYTAWTLMDNYEWAEGYTQRFGIHYINFTDPGLTRVPKTSAIFLKRVFAENGFPYGTILS